MAVTSVLTSVVLSYSAITSAQILKNKTEIRPITLQPNTLQERQLINKTKQLPTKLSTNSASNSQSQITSDEDSLWPMASIKPISTVSGLWRVPFTNNAVSSVSNKLTKPASCFEYYNFTPDQTISIASDNERITGSYDIQMIDNYAANIAIKVNWDNGKTDCNGKSVNQIGEVMQVSVLQSKDRRHMKWCEQNNFANCYFELERILP